MSPDRQKSDYFILAILGAITAGILFIFILLDLIGKDKPGMPGIRASDSTNVDGVLVCYTLFEKLGMHVERSQKALLGKVLSKIDVLFLLNPVIPMYEGEIRDIREWLTGGGVLICTNIPKGLHPFLQQFTQSSNSSMNPARKINSPINTAADIPAQHANLPLARDISKIYFETSNVIKADIPDFTQHKSSIETLLSDNIGSRIIKFSLGSGCIILLSDSSFLANGHIDKNDNAVLAVNLVSYAISLAENNNVVFDEYHFNTSNSQTGFGTLSKMLFSSAAGWSVLSLIIAGVFYIIYKGRRFGYRRSLENKHRRSKLEYIYSVGSAYHSAGANRLTLKIIYDWLRRKTSDITGLAPNASNSAIANELSRRSGHEPEKYKLIFDKCDKMMTQKKISERQMQSALKELASIEMEIFNEHRKHK
ncbi:MAG: DUF4350 domain-containing protein [Sedimentisphaerales bacterium]|nr:DUF4350 domain-containing protein [Sedimentisphaerales bacterium]